MTIHQYSVSFLNPHTDRNYTLRLLDYNCLQLHCTPLCHSRTDNSTDGQLVEILNMLHAVKGEVTDSYFSESFYLDQLKHSWNDYSASSPFIRSPLSHTSNSQTMFQSNIWKSFRFPNVCGRVGISPTQLYHIIKVNTFIDKIWIWANTDNWRDKFRQITNVHFDKSFIT